MPICEGESIKGKRSILGLYAFSFSCFVGAVIFNLNCVLNPSFILTLVSLVFLRIYTKRRKHMFQGSWVVSAIFFFLCVSCFLSIFTFRIRIGLFALESILNLALAMALLLAGVSSYSGFNAKTFITIAAWGGIVIEGINLISICTTFFKYMKYIESGFLASSLLLTLGYISFYIALLIFGRKNRVPPVRKAKNAKRDGSATNEEELLYVLNEKVVSGLITEEEYQEQRAKIIRNL